MAAQTVNFQYDAIRNILFTEDDYDIRTDADVDAFFVAYERQFVAIRRKTYVVAKIDGLHVGVDVFAYYGLKLKALSNQWTLGFARWGADPTSRMMVRAASRKGRAEINIYDTKEQAVALIERIRFVLDGGKIPVGRMIF